MVECNAEECAIVQHDAVDRSFVDLDDGHLGKPGLRRELVCAEAPIRKAFLPQMTGVSGPPR